jgi:DNA helicase HerA-like ATPase
MHNYFIHKLVNPYDLQRIRKAVAFLDENEMNALTVLGPCECIISGTGVIMLCFVKVNQVEKKLSPIVKMFCYLAQMGYKNCQGVRGKP